MQKTAALLRLLDWQPGLPGALPALAFLALLVPGCRFSERFQDPQPEMLTWATPLPVTLSNELRTLKEKTESSGEKTKFRVGDFLQRVFPARDGRSFLSLVNSDIEVTRSLGSWSTEYSLWVVLQDEGKYQLIQAAGSGISEEGPSASGRQAIEVCVESLYKRLLATLETARGTSVGEGTRP